MRVLVVTTEWPSAKFPTAVPFLVRQVDFLRRAGVDLDVFHFRGAKNPLNYLKAWFQVRKLLAQGKYDLVHAQWGQSAFPVLPKRLPLVTTFRGSDLAGIVGTNGRYLLSGYFLKIFSRYVARLSDQSVVVSKRLADKLPPGYKYHIIPSGLDLGLFRPMQRSEARKLLGWPEESRVVLFGRNTMDAVKRYELAQEAVRLLRDKFPDVLLLPAQNIPHKEMVYYLNASNVLLLTSLYEGSPNVVKEALACNVPVVSTDVGDVGERIRNIEGCVLCEADLPETICKALFQVLNQNLRISGRESVLSLDETLLTQKVLAVYQQALHNWHSLHG